MPPHTTGMTSADAHNSTLKAKSERVARRFSISLLFNCNEVVLAMMMFYMMWTFVGVVAKKRFFFGMLLSALAGTDLKSGLFSFQKNHDRQTRSGFVAYLKYLCLRSWSYQ
jgi:hypothetical protein